MRLLIGILLVISVCAGAHADFAEDASTTCQIAPGETVESDLSDAQDVDWCAIEVEEGLNYEVTALRATDDPTLTLANARIRFVSASGSLIGRSRQTNGDDYDIDDYNTTAYIGEADETVYLAISTSADGGSYRLTASPRDDIGATPTTAATLSLGEPYLADMESEFDHDWFKVDLKVGQGYLLDVLGLGHAPGATLPTPYLHFQVYESEGSKSDHHPFVRGRYFIAQRDATYFIEVVRRDDYPINPPELPGTYALSLTDRDEQDRRPTALGLRERAAFQSAGDTDSYTFDLFPNEHYQVTLSGSGIEDLTSPDACLELIGPSEDAGTQRLAEMCLNGESEVTAQFTNRFGGPAEITTRSLGRQVGRYAVGLSPRDDFVDTDATTGRVEPGFQVNGAIEAPGDIDWIKTPLRAGTPTDIYLTQAGGENALQDLVLDVVDPNGAVVASQLTPGLAPSVNFTGTADGDYTVRIADLCAGTSCATGPYALGVNQGGLPSVETTILAATVPQARTQQVGSGVSTFFATILNTGSETATQCGIALAEPTLVGLDFTPTDENNAIAGPMNTRVDIPAGAAQGFVIAVTPKSLSDGAVLPLEFDCANAEAAPNFVDVNGYTQIATHLPTPEPIVITATPNGDGIVRLDPYGHNSFFTVAVVNIGQSGSIFFSLEAVGEARTEFYPGSMCGGYTPDFECDNFTEEGYREGQTILELDTGQIGYLTVFLDWQNKFVPFDPARSRVRLIASDNESRQMLAVTSVAVTTN